MYPSNKKKATRSRKTPYFRNNLRDISESSEEESDNNVNNSIELSDILTKQSNILAQDKSQQENSNTLSNLNNLLNNLTLRDSFNNSSSEIVIPENRFEMATNNNSNDQPQPNEPIDVFKSLRVPDAIKDLPKFDGNPRLLFEFIQNVEEILSLIPQVDGTIQGKILLRAIRNKIIGPANEILNMYGTPLVWTSIRSNLVLHYSDKRNETSLIRDLHNLKQNQGSVEQFYSKIIEIFATISNHIKVHDTNLNVIKAKNDLYEEMCLNTFLVGLREPLGSTIRAMKPTTLPQAFAFCIQEQNIFYSKTNLSFFDSMMHKKNFEVQKQQPQYFSSAYNTFSFNQTRPQPQYFNSSHNSFNQPRLQPQQYYPQQQLTYQQRFPQQQLGLQTQPQKTQQNYQPSSQKPQQFSQTQQRKYDPMELGSTRVTRLTQPSPSNFTKPNQPQNFKKQELNNVIIPQEADNSLNNEESPSDTINYQQLDPYYDYNNITDQQDLDLLDTMHELDDENFCIPAPTDQLGT